MVHNDPGYTLRVKHLVLDPNDPNDCNVMEHMAAFGLTTSKYQKKTG